MQGTENYIYFSPTQFQTKKVYEDLFNSNLPFFNGSPSACALLRDFISNSANEHRIKDFSYQISIQNELTQVSDSELTSYAIKEGGTKFILQKNDLSDLN